MRPLVARATVNPAHLSRKDIADLARGCAFLGSGGGGDPHAACMEIEALLAEGRQSASSSTRTRSTDDAFVARLRLDRRADGFAGKAAERAARRCRACASWRKSPVAASMRCFPIEIGGSNGLAALVLALRSGLPVVDCDGMGRAFPESQMVIFNIRGQLAAPAILTDDKGTCVVVETDGQPRRRTARARSLRERWAASCHLIEYSADRTADQDATRCAARSPMRSPSAAALRLARERGGDPFAALFEALRGCATVQPRGRAVRRQDRRPAARDAQWILRRPRGDRRLRRAAAAWKWTSRTRTCVARLDGAGARAGARPHHDPRSRDGRDHRHRAPEIRSARESGRRERARRAADARGARRAGSGRLRLAGAVSTRSRR